MAFPHHVVSPPFNSICCLTKLILLQLYQIGSVNVAQPLSLACLSSLCEPYAAFCSTSCPPTITVAMTKGNICVHMYLHSTEDFMLDIETELSINSMGGVATGLLYMYILVTVYFFVEGM